MAETSRLLFPSFRFCIVLCSYFFLKLLKPAISEIRCVFPSPYAVYSDLREAISMEKRYFTSDLTIRS